MHISNVKNVCIRNNSYTVSFLCCTENNIFGVGIFRVKMRLITLSEKNKLLWNGVPKLRQEFFYSCRLSSVGRNYAILFCNQHSSQHQALHRVDMQQIIDWITRKDVNDYRL